MLVIIIFLAGQYPNIRQRHIPRIPQLIPLLREFGTFADVIKSGVHPEQSA